MSLQGCMPGFFQNLSTVLQGVRDCLAWQQAYQSLAPHQLKLLTCPSCPPDTDWLPVVALEPPLPAPAMQGASHELDQLHT